jgi:alkylation response protein AidB-like acyl-CoA dehydrogenase
MSTGIEPAGLSETQRQIVDLAREFARTRIEPNAAAWDRAAEFPAAILAELGTLGFLGMLTPDTHDGMGLDTLTYLLVLEEIAAGDAGLAVSVNIHHAVQLGLLGHHGTPAQRERWLPRLATGELLAALAVVEPDAGSDVAALRTQATRRGDAWVLSGTKAWVTNGATAGVAIVLARTAPGISAFIVPAGTAGYRPASPADTMGLRSAPVVSVALAEASVPADHLLGDEGRGLVGAQDAIDLARLGTAALAVGVARRALEHAVGYCGERRQFGKALREFEAVQFKLADMATRVAAARALAHEAAARADRGEPLTALASMSKLCASETAMWVTTQAVQLFGGYGYMRDFPVEKLLRDAKATELYDGTSEVQRLIVARDLYAGR